MTRPRDASVRDRILDAARHEFASHGLERTRVEDVARRAEVSKGGFYLHFQSKEQLCDELLLDVATRLERLLEETAECFSTLPASPAQFLTRWFRQDLNIFEFIRENRPMMTLVLEGGGSARYQHLIESFAERTERVVSMGLRTGIAVGYYRDDLDVASVAAFIAGGYDRLARRLVKMRREEDEDCVLARGLAQAIRQIVDGLATPTLAAVTRDVLSGLEVEASSKVPPASGAPLEQLTALQASTSPLH